MSKEPIDYLKHIADECVYIISVSSNLSKDEFLDDKTLKRASVRSLEIIGRVGKREFHPQASHRTVLESLPSHGSYYSLIIQQYPFAQW